MDYYGTIMENPNTLSFIRSGALYVDGSIIDAVDIRNQIFWFVRPLEPRSKNLITDYIMCFFQFLCFRYPLSVFHLSTCLLSFIFSQSHISIFSSSQFALNAKGKTKRNLPCSQLRADAFHKAL